MIRDWRGRGMLGHKQRNQLELFITGSLRQLIPDEHVLARVDRVLDLSWLKGEIADCYCLDDGRPGIDPEVVHIDASLIRANVSWESLVERHVEDVLSENRTEEEIEVERKGRQSGRYKKVCTTDPDATMATNARNRRLEPAYKQHTAVDDKVGVILDVAVTTGQTNEGEMIEPQVDEVKAITGIDIKTVTA